MRKRVKTPFNPQPGKKPKSIEQPDQYIQMYPSWRVRSLELVDPFGWHNVSSQKLHEIRKKLADFETMRWSEVFNRNNHRISTGDLCREAQRRLVETKQDDIDEVISLRLSGTERVFGILEQGVLRILWWDPNHLICPSLLRNT